MGSTSSFETRRSRLNPRIAAFRKHDPLFPCNALQSTYLCSKKSIRGPNHIRFILP